MTASRVGLGRLNVLLVTTLSVLALAVVFSPAASAGTMTLQGASVFSPLASPFTASSTSPVMIAEYGTDAGQVSWPQGAAVDRSNGDLYIAGGNNLGDGNTFRVSKFDPEGNFLFAVGYGVADGVTQELQTCGPQANPPTRHCFAPYFPVLFAPRSVAVDNSAGASHGDFYVGEKNRVSKFTSSGQLVFMVGKNVNKTKVEEAGATQAEKDLCTAASGDTCGQGESGTAANEFSSESMPLAVDSTGVVWVGDSERLISFDPAGVPGAEISLASAGDTHSLALDSSDDFYVRSQNIAGVRKLQAGTGTLLETLDASGQARPVAVDENDNVYIGDETSPYRFKVYDPAGEQTAQFGARQVIGAPGEGFFGTNAIAVDASTERLYSASSRTSEAESVVQAFPLPEPGPLPENEHVEKLLPSTVTLAAELNPEGHQSTYHFEWGTSESYGETTPTKTLAGEEFESEPVAARLEGLIPSTTYHFRLCATNSAGTACGQDTVFTTPSAVAIEPEWATSVTAHAATLHAELNPLGVEAETWLEWGTGEGYGQVVPLANLGEGFSPVLRQATLTGLQASTNYHYRFAARDTRDGNTYTVHGADRSFTTQAGSVGFQLADGRAWEMVSPPDKHGARLIGGGETYLQASADGEGLAYPSILSIEMDPEGNRIIEPSMNLARRQADGSWRSKDITPPNDQVAPITSGAGSEYKLFNPGLSDALLEPRSGTPLSPEASERTPYWRENTEPSVYRPLVTDKEGFADVPPGTGFGGAAERYRTTPYVRIQAATPDLRHVVLRSEVSLGPETPPVGGVYEWSNGQLQWVSVLPPAEGGGMVGGRTGSGASSLRGAISQDGSRVFWTAENPRHLYLRYNATEAASATSGNECTESEKACTVRLDVAEPGATGLGASEPIFQGANAAGTVVFFTDSQQLTEDASSKGSDLYRCELPSGNVASGCATLTDVSVAVGASKNAEVQGLAAAIAEGGQTIYFVAKGILDTGPNQLGQSAVAGEPNLYVWQPASGVRFIGTLSDADGADWGGLSSASASSLSAFSSPSGRYFAFMSKRALTTADTIDAVSGEAVEEVYRYDAAADQLECVSCNPSGSRARSLVLPDAASMVDPRRIWENRSAAAILPEAVSIDGLGETLYHPRAVLDNGRVFFNAADSLVPADSNGQWDVYQYEAVGVGDCSASSGGASISRLGGGCVSLISSGTAEEEAAFIDASETGDDVFFWTPAQLNETDEDHEVDIYDARVGGIPATRPNNVECLGEACQPAVQAPNDQTPASAAFQGAGNLKASGVRVRCGLHKRLVRRHGQKSCVSKRRRHKHHRKHRRAHSHRRAHR